MAPADARSRLATTQLHGYGMVVGVEEPTETSPGECLAPSDAGQYPDGLEALLRHIPDRWGASLGCHRGWYPLLARLNASLEALDPGYVLYQAKEKFGTLRFYWEPSPSRCCVKWHAAHPRPPAEDSAAIARYQSAWSRHERTASHQAEEERRSAILQAGDVFVGEAERTAAMTCEETGAPGVLMSTSDSGWVQTLDPTTAGGRYTRIVGSANRDVVLKATVDSAGDDPDALRDIIRELGEGLDHMTLVGQRLLDALLEARGTPEESRGVPTERNPWLRRAVAVRVLEDPERAVAKARETLARWRTLPGDTTRLDDWERLLDEQVESIVAVLCSSDPEVIQRYKGGPFAGLLSQAERWANINAWRISRGRPPLDPKEMERADAALQELLAEGPPATA